MSRILTDGSRVTGVETSRGTIAAPTVVVAAGAWTNQLFDPLGIDLGLRPIPARVAVFRWAYDRSPSHITYIDHINGTWARPTDGNSTLGGAEVAQTGTIDLDDISESLTQQQIEASRGQLVRRFPTMSHSTMRGNWAGVLSMSPDGRPLIGQLDQYDGLYTMAGDSGTCFKTAPAIGLCLSELITSGRATTVDLTPFRPSRFAEGQPWHDEHDYDLTQQTISR